MARKETLLREENIETLKLYMSGKSESAVGKAMGISRGGAKDRLQGYRDAGILEGSFNRGGTPSCHWDSLNALREEEGLSPIEEITPPDRNVEIRVSRPKPTTPEPISVPTPVSTPAQFTDAEVTLLKNLVRETQEKAAEPSYKLIPNSGNKTGRNFRIEDNLFAEVQTNAKKENISATAILERALREYLEVDYL